MTKSTFNTSCQDCIFAKWSDNVQTGCELQRLERFDINGGRSVVTDEKTGKVHSIIHRYCNGCHNKEHPVVKDLSVDLAIQEVRKKMRLQHTVVVHYRDGNNIDQLIKFIESCNNQTLPPTEIYVLNNTSDKETVRNALISCVRPGITWKHNFTEEIRSPESLLDSALSASNNSSITGDFFSIFFLPFELPNSFIENINVALNYRMERFVALKGFDNMGNGETFMTKVARSYKSSQEDMTGIFDGESEDDKIKKKKKKRVKLRGILNKLRYVAEKTNRTYQVRDIKDYVVI